MKKLGCEQKKMQTNKLHWTGYSQVLGICWACLEKLLYSPEWAADTITNVQSRKGELCNNALHSMSRSTTQLLSNSGPIKETEIFCVLEFVCLFVFVLVSDFALCVCISWSMYMYIIGLLRFFSYLVYYLYSFPPETKHSVLLINLFKISYFQNLFQSSEISQRQKEIGL